MDNSKHHFVNVRFKNFKAFKNFEVGLQGFNVLVGPNNAGKSTILAGFRILAAGLRTAYSKKAQLLGFNLGYGYKIDLTKISVAGENVFFNYDETQPAEIAFKLSNGNTMTLVFPESGECFLILRSLKTNCRTPTSVKKNFNCPIGFVPVLGPVDHHEQLYGKEAARLALFNYRAARNFRNIWHHYPEKFDQFRDLLMQTWPGMDIEPPEVDRTHDKPMLRMFCPENRFPRELFWAGFGFQVWCQMLTHIVQSSESALFLIDEPDIYLHSDLQRQLLGILRDLGPDIIIATHSTEIVAEADANEILLVNKKNSKAKRISDPAGLLEVYNSLGSNTNPILTQLAKNRKALFVEGKDFQILSKFAEKLGMNRVRHRQGFVVVPVGGHKPDGIKDLKKGMSTVLGESIDAMALFDRDYRSDQRCEEIIRKCKKFCSVVCISDRKEIENYVLVPEAIDRLVKKKIKRAGKEFELESTTELIQKFAEDQKTAIFGKLNADARDYHYKSSAKTRDESEITSIVLSKFERDWFDQERRCAMLPGKDALSFLNKNFQEKYGVSITPKAIINEMRVSEVPQEMRGLIEELSDFSKM